MFLLLWILSLYLRAAQRLITGVIFKHGLGRIDLLYVSFFLITLALVILRVTLVLRPCIIHLLFLGLGLHYSRSFDRRPPSVALISSSPSKWFLPFLWQKAGGPDLPFFGSLTVFRGEGVITVLSRRFAVIKRSDSRDGFAW